MDFLQRFEIIDSIGSGDFAMVYRARDRELGREVAIKQIHQQFLTDQSKLERYWQEAQLLASLEHPNVMTIYDISRPRGCLVLELMQGSLKNRTAGQPLNLDYLRVTLFHSLHALKFLHDSGVIHGDIKPGNLLIDKRNRIKVGDFGLARRVANDEGSLLKGSTKYIAPEVCSDQFGPVTAASDLYSLGFSAYELLCGACFEDLFPGLSAFGRDKQLAWIMWHAAPDRRLPEIAQVMEGVPADLAHVIQRLATKDPQQRYRTADEAINDLVHDPQLVAAAKHADEEAEAAQREAQAKKRKRVLAIAALAASVVMCLAVLLLTGGETPQPAPKFEPVQGVIGHVALNGRDAKLVVSVGADKKPPEITLRSRDEIRLNDKYVSLQELKPGDRVTVSQEMRDGQPTLIVIAARPESSRGKIKRLQPDEGQFVLSIDEGADQGVDLNIEAPSSAEISLNGEPARLRDLREGDRVDVTHAAENVGRVATAVSAVRAMPLKDGVIREVNTRKHELTLSLTGRKSLLTLPYRPDCEVTLNKLRFLNGAALKPADLQPGDRMLQLMRDTHVLSINAYRTFSYEGELLSVRPESGTIDVSASETGEFLTFRVGHNCSIQLGAETVALSALHRRDHVQITHDSPDRKNLDALAIHATRAVDKTRWALVIAQQSYDDKTLGSLANAGRDAEGLCDTLVKRYAVNPDQCVLLLDASRIRLEQEIPELMRKANEAAQLIVYVVGHAFVDTRGGVYLAPKDFAFNRMDSGLRLRWLVSQLETCGAREKLLLLDLCQQAPAEQAAKQPSTAEMVELYKSITPQPALKTVTVVASCSAGQRGLSAPKANVGLFSLTLSQALSGLADDNHDNRVTAAELFAFASRTMKKFISDDNQTQTPRLFPPDDTPPRLNVAARQAIRDQLAELAHSRIDESQCTKLFFRAEKLAEGEPEPKLAYGLALLQARQTDDALKQFEDVKLAVPKSLLAHQATVWLQFIKRNYVTAAAGLEHLVAAIDPPSEADEPYSEYQLELFGWVGRLRQYASMQDDMRIQEALIQLDQAVAKRQAPARAAYESGRAEVQERIARYDREIAGATDEARRTKLKLQRKQLANYVEFAVDPAKERILRGLE